MFLFVLFVSMNMYTKQKDYKIRVKVFDKYYIKGLDLKVLLVIMLPVIIAGLRFYVGVDYGSYENMFYLIKAGQGLDFELAYIVLNKIVGIFTNDFMVLTIIIAILTYYLAVKAIVKLCGEDKKAIPIVVWFYFLVMFSASLNTIRQTIAISIVMYGFDFIRGKKYRKYILCIIIATLFHSSAAVCLVFLLFNQDILNIKKFPIFLVIMCCSLLLVTNPVLLNGIITKLPILNRYIVYEMSSNYIFWKNFIVVAPYFIILLWYKKLKKENKKNLLLLNLMLFELILMILSVQFQWAFRMISYTSIAKYILLPQFLNVFRGKNVRTILTVAYMAFGLLMFIYGTYFGNLNGIFPYRTKWGGL